MKPSFWQEWTPPATGLLRAPGRARLGILPWCLLAICHAWDERLAAMRLAAERAEFSRFRMLDISGPNLYPGYELVSIDPATSEPQWRKIGPARDGP